MLKPIK